MTYHIIYSGVEVTEWCGGVVIWLHGKLIEVDGGFVELCGSSHLKAAKFETSGSQRSRQGSRGQFVHATSWELFEAFALGQLQPLTWVNLLH